MRDYLDALGHVVGRTGSLIQAVGGIFCLIGNGLILDDDSDDGPHPAGDTFTQAEHAGNGRGAPELQAGYRGTELEEDGGAYRLGFNNHHAR